ncbi:Hypothetical predicted protein [Cloeon dipterum]|uniref:EF-hand domain-containing protein n=1 Tax=Cloeon dipterum TaxID=197152 RepID=A0A8S1CYJ5_9INSE|nr:Hypothetical predicted protein [Cloeon dipterum]
MHQLFRAIGTVSCLLPWILLLSGARTAAGDNVEPSKRYNILPRRAAVPRVRLYLNDAMINIFSQQPSLQNVPQSRADMAPNAAPFHAAPNKNPLFLRSLINSASNKLVHGAFAGKRFDAPGSPFLPPGGPLGSPGGPLGFPGSPLGSPGGLFRSPGGPFGSPGNPFVSPGGSPGPHGIPLGVPGQGLPPQAFAGGPLAGAGLQYFPQQRPLVPHPAQVAQPAGQKLTQKEFQQYMKAAAASKHVDTDNYLTKDQFQEYLKLATSDKKNKIKGAQSTLTPGEFEKLVLDAQHDLLKGKPNKGKLKTLTHEDFKKFFEKENGRPGSAATPGKKHKRGHYSPSASSFSSSGSASFSDEYSSPPKYLPAHPPKFESESEVYPEVFPAHQIETEDQLTKRSVLDALWRAFQAITGGALTIGGHLARGGGALLEAKGKLIASAGPVVSDFGRTVAAKAVAPGYSSVHSHVTPYHNYRDYVEESHAPQSSLLQTAYDVASSLKVAALGTTKAVADLISELSSASAKAYLLKD